MKVRDRTYKVTDYKGRWTEAVDAECPCRRCYNAHDCGYRRTDGIWVTSMECATNHSNGCPGTFIDGKFELVTSTHLFRDTKRFSNRKRGDVFRCVRCGQKYALGEIKFLSESAVQANRSLFRR